jgi:hypothetical protein
MPSQEPWSDDLLQRSLVERAPPLTWVGVLGWGLVAVVGAVLGLAGPGKALEAVAVALAVVGGLQVLRGLIRKLWLVLGGTDQPLRSYLHRRFGD